MVDWSLVIAGFAAGVSVLVGLRQIMVDLPRAAVKAYRDARLIPGGVPVTIVEVTNTGRRPLRINMVAYLAEGRYFMNIPSLWAQHFPFSIGEGESYQLQIDPSAMDVPDDAVFVARDTVGRWWPRSRRWRVWLRIVGLRGANRRGRGKEEDQREEAEP